MKMKLINTLTLITWVAVLMVACGRTSSDPLNGTTWELHSIGRYAPIPGSTTTIRFEDGQVSGVGGCNQYGGQYNNSGQALSISALYSTEMACSNPEGIMDQEQRFLQSLGEARSFEIVAGRLQIHLSGGEALTFIPAR